VLSFTIKCNLYSGLCKRVHPFRHIANISGLGDGFQREGSLQLALKKLYAVAMARTETIFFQNRDDLSLCVKSGMAPLSSSMLIPGSGIDLSAFNPRAFSSCNRTPQRTTFLMFGRLLPQKGFYSFMHAAHTLRKKWGDRVAFWIMGAPDHDRPESGTLLEAIIRSHAAGDVRYLQSTDDVRPILAEATAVVLPSTYNEGVPRSLLEALAMAKPIVTTDWRGCKETVRHGVNGFLCRPNDDDALISALDSVIMSSPERLAEMGRAGRALAEEQFDEGLVINAYLNALYPLAEQGERTSYALNQARDHFASKRSEATHVP
jgi:glycosyltransferase involved in cell wall biosynthesis